ncbi:MAG: 3-phosphoserine/phosphohydroxythreonine transaminase [Pseudomonadales bacterium]|nr:3-phosphoserine/phosphohydroxythreonine transaminase [Pseudomonadales bacterium]
MSPNDRSFNFSAGPAGLPLPVLEQVKEELLNFRGCGASILEISHRSNEFIEVLDSARQGIRTLLEAGDEFEILFLQGGSRLQFSMIPMNLLRTEEDHGAYLVTGAWSDKAFAEASRSSHAQLIWSGVENGFCDLPTVDQLQQAAKSDCAYLYYTSNETIHGVQHQQDLQHAVAPTVCDASSDFLSRPVDIQRHGILYACAQKNAGPAGVTIVVIRKDLLNRSRDDLPGYLNYRRHADENSMYNTPPTFAIYIADLVCRWLESEMGGLDQMAQFNQEKSSLLYTAIDEMSNMYQGHAARSARSHMNVTFRLRSDELTDEFVRLAEQQGLTNLRGHRSVGGIRASIYNAMPHAGVLALRNFMESFYTQNRSSK